MAIKHYTFAGLLGLAIVVASAAVAQGTRNTRDVGGPTATQVERGGKTSALTPGECEGLGGKIRFTDRAGACDTPFVCVTEDRVGTIQAICIDEYDQSARTTTAGGATHNPSITQGQTPVERPGSRRPSPNRDVRGQPATVATPLTTAECKALGGFVVDDTRTFCSRAKQVCVRIDQNGKAHNVCINEQ